MGNARWSPAEVPPSDACVDHCPGRPSAWHWGEIHVMISSGGCWQRGSVPLFLCIILFSSRNAHWIQRSHLGILWRHGIQCWNNVWRSKKSSRISEGCDVTHRAGFIGEQTVQSQGPTFRKKPCFYLCTAVIILQILVFEREASRFHFALIMSPVQVICVKIFLLKVLISFLFSLPFTIETEMHSRRQSVLFLPKQNNPIKEMLNPSAPHKDWNFIFKKSLFFPFSLWLFICFNSKLRNVTRVLQEGLSPEFSCFNVILNTREHSP